MKVANTAHRRRRHAAAPMAEINIIPLVDVTLVLLIIFMATTAFVREAGLNIKLPSARSTEQVPDENKDMTVVLTRDAKLYLDGAPTTEAGLESAMVARARRNAETRVVIKADERIAYQRVVRVMDITKQAGLPRVALGTTLPDGGDFTPQR